MQFKKMLAIIITLLVWSLFSQSTFASCYTIPHQVTYLSTSYLQGFEGESTTCPQSSGDRWIEVCAKPANIANASYSLCATGYSTSGGHVSNLNFYYNTPYDVRVRYRKTDGSLGVLMSISLSGISNGNSGGGNGGGSGGVGHPNCPPYNPNCTCAAGYPMGSPLCD